MSIEELARYYVKTFKKGPLSSETRKAYESLKQYGDLLGVNLNKTFFQDLIKKFQSEPQKYMSMNPEEINQDILAQCRMYMQQVQEKQEKLAVEAGTIKKQDRRGIIEII